MYFLEKKIAIFRKVERAVFKIDAFFPIYFNIFLTQATSTIGIWN